LRSIAHLSTPEKDYDRKPMETIYFTKLGNEQYFNEKTLTVLKSEDWNDPPMNHTWFATI
jgi:hypothetical protein